MDSKSFVIKCLATAVLMLASGCTGQMVTPSANSIVMPKAPMPIPATIGISRADQKLSGGFSDIVHDFKKYVDESALFQTVYYPIRPGDRIDGTIALSVKTKVNSDAWTFPKAFITGFCLNVPEPLIYYHDRYQAQCTVDFVKGDRHLKTYTAEGTITASHKLLYRPDQLRDDGTEGAGKLLWANLIEQLINDGAFLAHELMATPTTDQFIPIPNQSLMLRTGGQ